VAPDFHFNGIRIKISLLRQKSKYYPFDPILLESFASESNNSPLFTVLKLLHLKLIRNFICSYDDKITHFTDSLYPVNVSGFVLCSDQCTEIQQ
jgi:hypothetical protein